MSMISLLLEIVLVGSVTYSNVRLAHKQRDGWLWYILASLCVIFLFVEKGLIVSIVGQSLMILWALYAWFFWDKKDRKQLLNLLISLIGVTYIAFVTFWVQGFVLSSMSEMILWGFIFISRIYLGIQKKAGWYILFIQGLVGGFFYFIIDLWMFFVWHILLCIQALYGVWEWHKEK